MFCVPVYQSDRQVFRAIWLDVEYVLRIYVDLIFKRVPSVVIYVMHFYSRGIIGCMTNVLK